MPDPEQQPLPLEPFDFHLASGEPQAMQSFPANPEEGAVYYTPPMVGRQSDAWHEQTTEQQIAQLDRRIDLLTDIGRVSSREMKNLRQESLTDTLTGLKNRRALMLDLADRIKNKPGDFAIAFIDLDKFKLANDTLGHDAGDEVLKVVADKMQLILRTGETLARIGGDEFVAVLDKQKQGNKNRHGFSEEGFEHRSVKEVEKAAKAAGAPFVSASVGIVNHRKNESAAQLLGRGDKKMYAIKQARKAPR